MLLVIPVIRIVVAASSAKDPMLPAEAVVIERATIPQSIHQNRELVLWMLSPQRHDRGELSESNVYTCPDETLGSYYSGPTRISLVDTSSEKLINTVTLHHAFEKDDSFDIPYRILADYYYLVPGQEHGTEGKPALRALRDVNGDGLALETVFYEAEACMGLPTTLIGYSPKRDKVIQYEVELRTSEEKTVNGRGIMRTGKATRETSTWVDYLFARRPNPRGHWSYQIDYTGRGGTLDSYDVHYDRAREKFFGTLSSVMPPWDAP